MSSAADRPLNRHPHDAHRDTSNLQTPLVLALLGDLLLASRVEAAAHARGYIMHDAPSLDSLRAVAGDIKPAVVVIDLAAAAFPFDQAMQTLRECFQPLPPLLCFYPHVQRELGQAAQGAGAAIVVPRSRFVGELAALLQRAIAGDALTETEPLHHVD